MVEHVSASLQDTYYATGINWKATCSCGTPFNSPERLIAEANLVKHIQRMVAAEERQQLERQRRKTN